MADSQSVDELPDHLLWDVFSRLHTAPDRNSTALVNRRFYDLERLQRQALKLGCGPHPVQFALPSLCSRFPNLSKIEVVYSGWMSKFGKQLDDEGLKIIATLCPRLQDVGLSSCTYITDVGLGNLAACKGLRALKLNFAPGITGRGLLSLVTSCKDLALLHLILCLHVNNVEWMYSLRRLEKMEDLAICHCKGIREVDLARLGHAWRRLRKIQFEVDANYRHIKDYEHLIVDVWQMHEVNCEALQELSLVN